MLGGAGPAAAVAACSPVPTETIIPYVVPPDDVVPGVATWYASVCGECPNGCGTRVRTREVRAIKIEGNPAHPGNQGALCTRGQAALQGLYNPDRFRGPQRRRTTNAAAGQSVFEPVSWEDAEGALAERIRALVEGGNADRIAVVTPLLSGTLDALVDRWAAAVGGARRLRYEAFAYEPPSIRMDARSPRRSRGRRSRPATYIPKSRTSASIRSTSIRRTAGAWPST